MLKPCYQSDPSPVINRNEITQLSKLRERVGTYDTSVWQRAMQFQDATKMLKRKLSFVPINRAFFKMHELLHSANLDGMSKCSMCVSLCEAPGGFVQALQSIYPDATCKGFSLRTDASIPFSSAFGDDVFPNVPNNGDIFNLDTRESIVRLCGKNASDIVTADGGISQDLDLGNAEQNSFNLLLAQVVLILQLQAQQGASFIKIFEGSTLATIDVYRCLNMVYDDVCVVKPHSSRQTNSERYIIATGYDVEQGLQLAKELENILNFVRSTKSYVYTLLDSPVNEDDLDKFTQLSLRQSAALQFTMTNIDSDNFNNFHKTRTKIFDIVLKTIPKNLLITR